MNHLRLLALCALLVATNTLALTAGLNTPPPETTPQSIEGPRPVVVDYQYVELDCTIGYDQYNQPIQGIEVVTINYWSDGGTTYHYGPCQ